MKKFLSEEEMSDLAFELMASSTGDRYVSKARELGLKSKVAQDIQSGDTETLCLLHDRCKLLFERIGHSPDVRDVDEVELAGLLPVYFAHAAPTARHLLQEINTTTAPSFRWLRYLAKSLLEDYDKVMGWKSADKISDSE